jgi:trans-aconitate methyltransferase
LWEPGAVETLVNQLSSSPDLAPRVDVRVVAVALEPQLLPPVPAIKGQPSAPPLSSGAVALPPTCTLVVTAVVRNNGSVAAAKVPVQASVQPVTGGPAFLVSRAATLAPGGSVALQMPAIAVKPSTTYTLSVTLRPPAGQTTPVGESAATIAVSSFGSAAADAACARTPAAAP